MTAGPEGSKTPNLVSRICGRRADDGHVLLNLVFGDYVMAVAFSETEDRGKPLRDHFSSALRALAENVDRFSDSELDRLIPLGRLSIALPITGNEPLRPLNLADRSL